MIDLPATISIKNETDELPYYTQVNSAVGVPVNLMSHTKYTITVTKDGFYTFTQNKTFYKNVDYIINITQMY